MSKKHIPGIQIRIDKVNSQHIRNWLSDIDWQIISDQIEERGSIVVRDYQPPDSSLSSRFHRLEKLPTERGRFRPHYGEFGGGFQYHIRSHAQGTRIVGHSNAAKFYKITPPPLDIILPNKIEIMVSTEGVENFGVFYPHDNQFKAGENTFAFFGEFFQLFHAWKWYSEDTDPFEFQFIPMSVGCLVRVLHIESNTLLDLTEDVGW